MSNMIQKPKNKPLKDIKHRPFYHHDDLELLRIMVHLKKIDYKGRFLVYVPLGQKYLM